MKRILSLIIIILTINIVTKGQGVLGDDGFTVMDDNDVTNTFSNKSKNDSTGRKEFPRGMYVWTVDRQFGDIQKQDRDTVQHLFMNTFNTTGVYGEYNTTGNLGSPRLNRIYIDRKNISDFSFVKSLDYFIIPVEDLRFTNTLSNITNLRYGSCGDKQDGEDYLCAKFAINAGKQIGAGMMFNYLYGRGYYASQATALFDWSFWASYLGERYQAHFIFSTDHMKLTENGGIVNDEYITHPEAFTDNYTTAEIPTALSRSNSATNWNQIDALHFFLTHRYNIGFSKKVPMTEDEIKAKRFALQAEKEKKEKEAAAAEQKKHPERTASAGGLGLSGRPSDAKIAGDLPIDEKGDINTKRIAINDSVNIDTLESIANVQVPDTSWLKDEYVPVTSFIHTFKLDKYLRVYRGQYCPDNYYNDEYATMASTERNYMYDETNHYQLRNTFAVGMLEGFNKWAKAGMKIYASHVLDHYELPELDKMSSSYNENTFFGGAQLNKTQGRTLHYNVIGELGLLGQNIGNLAIDFDGDLNIPLFGDTTRIFLKGFFHRQNPDFLMRKYHSNHFWWDNNFKAQMSTHLEGKLSIDKTKTTLRVAYDNIENYTYLGMSYTRNSDTNMPQNYTVTSRQTAKNISLLTAEVYQDVRLGIFNWENRFSFQKSTEQTILPVPTFNVWTNLYLNFKIARVLHVHLGADATWFSEYEAPEYCGQLASYAVQENADVRTKVGNYPFVNAYANFTLKGCRFFIEMTHVNFGQGTPKYFTTPHFPMNQRVTRFGISWYFYN